MDEIRNDIENIIKDEKILRDNFFEVSKLSYKNILKKIEKTFIIKKTKCEGIHWAWENRFSQKVYTSMESKEEIYRKLALIFNKNEYLYFIVEGEKKYWIYEGKIDSIINILDNSYYFEYYITTKTFDLLICENHHGLLFFTGTYAKEFFNKFSDLVQK